MARTNFASPIDGALSTRGRGESGHEGIARSGNRGAVIVTDARGGTNISQPWNDGSWTPTSKHNGNGKATMVNSGNALAGLGDASVLAILADPIGVIKSVVLHPLQRPLVTLTVAAAIGAAIFFLKKK